MIEKNITSFFIKYPEVFTYMISIYYPFKKESLYKYKDQIDWNNISENKSIKWDRSMLRFFSGFIDWEIFSSVSSVFNEPNIIEEFNDLIDWGGEEHLTGDTIASNEKLNWTTDFIKKYESKLNFHKLSLNTKLPWSEALIDKYYERWDFRLMSENEALPWSLSFFKKYFKLSDLMRLFTSINESINGNYEIVEEYKKIIGWSNICINTRLPWHEKDLLIRWKDQIDWSAIACNDKLFQTSGFFEKNMDKWMDGPKKKFKYLSNNKRLNWSVNFIDKYYDYWDWEFLSQNPVLPWNIDFIDYYASSIHWGKIALEETSLYFDEEYSSANPTISIRYDGLNYNKGVPWSIDLINHFEDKFEIKMLRYNSAVWEKAFKPFVNEKLIDLVFRII